MIKASIRDRARDRLPSMKVRWVDAASGLVCTCSVVGLRTRWGGGVGVATACAYLASRVCWASRIIVSFFAHVPAQAHRHTHGHVGTVLKVLPYFDRVQPQVQTAAHGKATAGGSGEHARSARRRASRSSVSNAFSSSMSECSCRVIQRCIPQRANEARVWGEGGRGADGWGWGGGVGKEKVHQSTSIS